MNRHHESKYSVFFARRWLEEVLIQCRRMKGFLHFLRKVGHLHYRYTSFDIDEKKYTVENFLRIEVNMAMVLDESEFYKNWSKLGRMIYDLANNNGDEFNEKHEKRKYRSKEESTAGVQAALGPKGRFACKELEGVCGNG